MSYTIRSTEKTRKSGAEYETKALLYLMNFRDDSNEIHYFVVDFFNDLTGINRLSTKTWDLQSKASKNSSPKEIGKELVTLYKNYLSEISFDNLILFIGGVTSSFRKDDTLFVFDSSNIKEEARCNLITGLKEEAYAKTYIDNSAITDSNIDDFLNKLTFVVDDKEKSEYVKAIIKVNPLIIPSNTVLEQIFNEIRDAQSAKKNNSCVEGITINTTSDFIFYNRHLTSSEIKMSVLNQLINQNLMEKGITPSFLVIYNKFPATEQKAVLEDCQLEIAKTLFDKNNSENFWALFGHIYETIIQDRSLDVDAIYNKLDINILSSVNYLTTISIKYFIAKIKDGLL